MLITSITVTDLADAAQMNPEHRKMLPRMAFSGFLGRYQEPTLEEGFEDVTTIDFKVSQAMLSQSAIANCQQLHGTSEQIETWSQYWIS